RGVRAVVLFARVGAEADPHRNVAAAAGGPGGERLMDHGQARCAQQVRDLDFQPGGGRTHGGDLEITRELEAVFRIVGLDFHWPIMGPAPGDPNASAATPWPGTETQGVRWQARAAFDDGRNPYPQGAPPCPVPLSLPPSPPACSPRPPLSWPSPSPPTCRSAHAASARSR